MWIADVMYNITGSMAHKTQQDAKIMIIKK